MTDEPAPRAPVQSWHIGPEYAHFYEDGIIKISVPKKSYLRIAARMIAQAADQIPTIGG